jgi:sterol desaturase/sphingolipid hydroxylase (fatty acid hydroxylase superfamily)
MFYLAPHPKLARPLRGSPRMFIIDWVEKYFSRVKWWHVIAIWVPVSIYCLTRALRDSSTQVLPVVGIFALGVLAWTLLEYLLHRFIFHFEPDPNSELQTESMYLIHGIHHDYPWDGDRLVMPPFVTFVVSALLWIPMRWAFGPHYMFAFYGGIVAGYVAYDLTHYWLHHAVPKSRLGKWMRSYHLVHHFSTPHVRYGITTPLWDHIFRTYPTDKYAGISSTKVDELESHA